MAISLLLVKVNKLFWHLASGHLRRVICSSVPLLGVVVSAAVAGSFVLKKPVLLWLLLVDCRLDMCF